MNQALGDLLTASGVTVEPISKSAKVKILTRWTKDFPQLVAYARHGRRSPTVADDNAADERYGRLRNEEFYVLPDDASAMPSFSCRAEAMPDLRELVSDTFTKCDELVVVQTASQWSAVFVNHGSPELVARYYQDREMMSQM